MIYPHLILTKALLSLLSIGYGTIKSEWVIAEHLHTEKKWTKAIIIHAPTASHVLYFRKGKLVDSIIKAKK